MNCVILLLLLSCCGGCGGCRTSGRTGCCCRENRREHKAPCRRMQGDCDCRNKCHEHCCENEKPVCNDDCGCAREERECRDMPGMIPPPWQDDYPKFPRRDDNCGCEG